MSLWLELFDSDFMVRVREEVIYFCEVEFQKNLRDILILRLLLCGYECVLCFEYAHSIHMYTNMHVAIHDKMAMVCFFLGPSSHHSKSKFTFISFLPTPTQTKASNNIHIHTKASEIPPFTAASSFPTPQAYGTLPSTHEWRQFPA